MTSAATTADTQQAARPDLVVDLSRFAATLDASRLDAAVVKAVKTNILDTLSCALAGSSAKAIPEVVGLISQKLAEALGQQVIVDNRPGGGASVGMELGLRAPPDGYMEP
jgi:Tripartite tricarboxylate transporter family receptor